MLKLIIILLILILLVLILFFRNKESFKNNFVWDDSKFKINNKNNIINIKKNLNIIIEKHNIILEHYNDNNILTNKLRIYTTDHKKYTDDNIINNKQFLKYKTELIDIDTKFLNLESNISSLTFEKNLNFQKNNTVLDYNSIIDKLKKENDEIKLKKDSIVDKNSIVDQYNYLNIIYNIKFQINIINIDKNVKKISHFNDLEKKIDDNTKDLSSLNIEKLKNIKNTDDLNVKIKKKITDIDNELMNIHRTNAEIKENIENLNNIFDELFQIFKYFDLQKIQNIKSNIKNSMHEYEDILKNFKKTNIIYIPLFRKIKELYKPILKNVNTDGDTLNNYNSVYKHVDVTDLMNEYDEYKKTNVRYTDKHLKKCIDNKTVCKSEKSKLCSKEQHDCNKLICEKKLVNNQDVVTNDRYFKDNKCYQQSIKEIPYL